MEKSFGAVVRKIQGKSMSTFAGTFDANLSLADALRGLAAKWIARKAQTTPQSRRSWPSNAGTRPTSDG